MIFDPASGTYVLGPDTHREKRLRRLKELGLAESPDEEFDAFATQLARDGGEPFAMVNLFFGRQYFAGLHSPSGHGELPNVGRTMEFDHGFCPHMRDRTKALILPDVCAYPRFASNPVVGKLGIRTYAGAQLTDHATGTTLGSICIVGPVKRPQETGQELLAFIKKRRDELMNLIYERADRKAL